MLGLYFSGTGNSEYCVRQFAKLYDENSSFCSIESNDAISRIKENDTIVIGYPVQYSNIPKILRDFVTDNCQLWVRKRIYIIATMALFSGDGAGVAARLLRKYGADIVGGLHIIMPDSICDEKVLKHTDDKSTKTIAKAKEKINNAVISFKNGKPTHEGLRFHNRIIGLFGQRLYFGRKANRYSNKLKIDNCKCISCKKCVKICPMNNITVSDDIITQNGKCTMCYRCINSCPSKAITLLGKEVVKQYDINNYIKQS